MRHLDPTGRRPAAASSDGWAKPLAAEDLLSVESSDTSFVDRGGRQDVQVTRDVNFRIGRGERAGLVAPPPQGSLRHLGGLVEGEEGGVGRRLMTEGGALGAEGSGIAAAGAPGRERRMTASRKQEAALFRQVSHVMAFPAGVRRRAEAYLLPWRLCRTQGGRMRSRRRRSNQWPNMSSVSWHSWKPACLIFTVLTIQGSRDRFPPWASTRSA